jgi:hypothetical protein
VDLARSIPVNGQLLDHDNINEEKKYNHKAKGFVPSSISTSMTFL